MRRLWKLSLWSWGLTLAVVVFVEGAFRYEGSGSRTYHLRVEPPPGLLVTSVRDGGRPATPRPDGTFEVWVLAATSESPFRIWRDSYQVPLAAWLEIELDNGESWLNTVPLPQDRVTTSINCRVADGKKFREGGRGP